MFPSSKAILRQSAYTRSANSLASVECPLNGERSWAARGRQFELTERAEWLDVYDTSRLSFDSTLQLTKTRRGRPDILIEEADGAWTIIEVKSTDWDRMADYRVRPNVQRHARQVMKYVLYYWEQGVDTIPGLIYPRAPSLRARRQEIEDILEERSVQVVWFDERNPQS